VDGAALAAGSAVDHGDLRPATSWLLDLLGHSLRHLVDLAAASRESTNTTTGFGRWSSSLARFQLHARVNTR